MKNSVITLMLLSIAFVGSVRTSAQTTIRLDIQQSFGPEAYLYRHDADGLNPIDTVNVGMDGFYRFALPANARQGQYQIQIGRASTIDLLVHNEPIIDMRTTIFAVEDSLKILQSDENKAFRKYTKIRNEYQRKHKLIEQLIKLYPAEDAFNQQLTDEQTRIQNEFRAQAQQIANAHHNLLAASYISIDPETHPWQPQPESADVYWQNIDLTQRVLLNTPMWEASLWHFVGQLQRKDDLDKEQQDDLYATAFKALLRRPMDDSVKASIVQSLCNGFSNSDYYNAIEMLLSKGGRHADATSNDPEVRQRLKQERPLAIGAKAHDFKYVTVPNERILRLSNSPGRYRLLLFWSIWCPHCVELLPELRQLYSEYHSKGLEIIGISVNVDDPEVANFVQSNELPWLNTVFTSKNEEELAKNYNVDGTPKMLLIDDKMRIVSKPITISQLRLKLERLLGVK